MKYPCVGPYCRAAVISFFSRFIVVPPFTLTDIFSNGNIPGFGTPPARNTKLGDPWVKSLAERTVTVTWQFKLEVLKYELY